MDTGYATVIELLAGGPAVFRYLIVNGNAVPDGWEANSGHFSSNQTRILTTSTLDSPTACSSPTAVNARPPRLVPRPALFVHVSDRAAIARDEIFGPVLSITWFVGDRSPGSVKIKPPDCR